MVCKREMHEIKEPDLGRVNEPRDIRSPSDRQPVCVVSRQLVLVRVEYANSRWIVVDSDHRAVLRGAIVQLESARQSTTPAEQIDDV